MTDFVSCKEAKEMRHDINVQGRVQKGDVKEQKTKYGKRLVCPSYLVDETDIIKLALWESDIGKVKNGDIVSIYGAYTTRFRNEVQLNIPKKNGKLEVILDDDVKKRWLDKMSERNGTDYHAIEKENEEQRQKFKKIKKRSKDKKDERDEIEVFEVVAETTEAKRYTDLQNSFSRPAKHTSDIKYDTKQESENTKEDIVKTRKCPNCLSMRKILDDDFNYITCPVCNGEGKVIVKKEEAKTIDVSKLKFVTVSRAKEIKVGINIEGSVTLKDDPQRLSRKYRGKSHDYLDGELTDEEGETITVTFHGGNQLKNIMNGTEVRIIGGHIYNDNLTIPENGKVEILSG
jgi:hypothetical protein